MSIAGVVRPTVLRRARRKAREIELAIANPDRIWSAAIETPSGCWEWTKRRSSSGYAATPNGQMVHRLAYRLGHGPIPAGLQVDHLCGNRVCINPAHLEAVTGAENNARSMSPSALNARKTHCAQGHEYDEANTYRNPRGHRKCLICGRTWRARYRAKHRGSQV